MSKNSRCLFNSDLAFINSKFLEQIEEFKVILQERNATDGGK